MSATTETKTTEAIIFEALTANNVTPWTSAAARLEQHREDAQVVIEALEQAGLRIVPHDRAMDRGDQEALDRVLDEIEYDARNRSKPGDVDRLRRLAVPS